MPVIEIDYRPREFQKSIHDKMRKHRFGVLVCHRRFGKTVLGVNELQRGALTCKKERPRYGYIGPTYRQGKAVAFDYMQHYAAPIPAVQVNQSELRVDYPNGGQSRIYGSDNPDNLRGLYFDGVVLDEYGLHPAKVYSEVIAATLVDRGGWALFLGTPNGKNQFYEIAQHARAMQAKKHPDWFYCEYKASDTGLLDAAYLEQAKAIMTTDEYAQEYECSFEAAVKGAIYSKEISAAREDGRIGNVPFDPALAVDTDWDLGIGDAMAIWFSQSTKGGEIRLIDYYEASGEGFPHYVQMLRKKGYAYGTHWAPHDIQVRELSSGRTRLEVAASQGIKFEVTPRLHRDMGGEVEEGIHAARMLFSRCYFDQKKASAGLEALQHYRRDYNERLNEFKATPVHDWACFTPDTKVLMRSGPHQAQPLAIMDLPKDGEVLTPCGWKRYQGPRITRRNARLVAVTFEDGSTVKCTPDHLFATESGWTSAESLTPGSLILSCSIPSASTSTADSIVSGQRSVTSRGVALVSTVTCGLRRSVRFLMGVMSTTVMEMLRTTLSPILSVCPPRSTCLPSGTRASLGGGLTSPQPLGAPLPHGIALRQDAPGTDDMRAAARAGRSGSGSPSLAGTAARWWTCLSGPGTARSTAPKPARPKRIASVTPLDDRADTCCIHVPDVECFALANGAIVHNSHGADAFRGLAVRHQIPKEKKRKAAVQMPDSWVWS